jgi:uncharacterized membrane protein YphA (DoxX/SURF4 family)
MRMTNLQQDEYFETDSPAESRLMHWMTKHSLTLMRLSLGFVFLLFGVLKFIPDASPAENLSVRTLEKLSFGLVEGDVARIVVAVMEVVVGISLLTGLFLKAGVILLGFVLIGIMAPLALFTGELFPGPRHTPTLEAQYVIKDIVLGAAGIHIALRARGAKMVVDEAPGKDARES